MSGYFPTVQWENKKGTLQYLVYLKGALHWAVSTPRDGAVWQLLFLPVETVQLCYETGEPIPMPELPTKKPDVVNQRGHY